MKAVNIDTVQGFAPDWIQAGDTLPQYTLDFQYGDEVWTGQVALSDYNPVSGQYLLAEYARPNGATGWHRIMAVTDDTEVPEALL